jgi:hypothetical protein
MIHLQRSLIAGLREPAPKPETVQDKLQQAIKLEHATIPLYLYALYSLDQSKNREIAGIIQSVVVEEMLHMTLASNVLNALGGSPVIDNPDFIPTYPGPLPGGVESELKVNLAPFSMTQLEAFLKIESPENPLHFPAALVAESVITIGEFYTAIADAITTLGDGAFVNPPRNQVGPNLMRESVVVTNVATARQAIQIIIDQGEGTSTSPEEGEGSGYAHYYRFMQIQKGHLLVPVPGATQPDQKYAYTGTTVPFDASGVHAVPTNPGVPPGYPAGSVQAFANDNFNYTYTSLLIALHGLFNGQNTQDQFNDVIGLMMSLKSQARAMMSGIPNPAVLVGPSFQYQPTNPAR